MTEISNPAYLPIPIIQLTLHTHALTLHTAPAPSIPIKGHTNVRVLHMGLSQDEEQVHVRVQYTLLNDAATLYSLTIPYANYFYLEKTTLPEENPDA